MGVPSLNSCPLPSMAVRFAIHGDGSQTRSFCYVSDLVDGLLAVALDP